MINTTKDDRSIMDKVEKVICKYFNVTSISLVDKDTSNNVSMARGFLFHILHKEYKFSANKIADNYLRKRRGVFLSLSKINHQIRLQKVYKNIYEELLDMIYK